MGAARFSAEGAPGIGSCRFSARMAQQGMGSLGFSWFSGRGIGLVSQGSGVSWLCDAASSGAARLPVSSGMMPS
jgi:hypothetical protein